VNRTTARYGGPSCVPARVSSASMPPDAVNDPDARRFEVVFLCTGNRARSPLAAALLRHHAGAAEIAVRSVGTLDLGPLPALPEAVKAGVHVGVHLDSHRAATLRPGELAAADLVIGFEPFHVSTAVMDGGAPRERVFSILELVELLEQVDAGGSFPVEERDPRAILARANALGRGSFLAAPAVADPIGRPQKDFDHTAAQLDELVEVIARVLFRPTHVA
jgi:protein-tyrosine phosphatase